MLRLVSGIVSIVVLGFAGCGFSEFQYQLHENDIRSHLRPGDSVEGVRAYLATKNVDYCGMGGPRCGAEFPGVIWAKPRSGLGFMFSSPTIRIQFDNDGKLSDVLYARDNLTLP